MLPFHLITFLSSFQSGVWKNLGLSLILTTEKAELNEKLRHFMRRQNLKLMKREHNLCNMNTPRCIIKNTLTNFRAALNRNKDLNRNFDIVHDSDFRTSNIILDSTLKMMVKTGLSRPTKHKEIIGLQDLQLINGYLNKIAKNPVLLRLRVWFNLAIHFVSRGLEFHHQLNLNSFDFHVDAEGDEYATINYETQQQNIQGRIMCEEAPADKFMKMFISKTDPNAK